VSTDSAVINDLWSLPSVIEPRSGIRGSRHHGLQHTKPLKLFCTCSACDVGARSVVRACVVVVVSKHVIFQRLFILLLCMLIDLTMKPTSGTNFVACLRELCAHNDVFRAKFGRHLPNKVRPL
jgi:hypothetical protein